MASRRRRNPSSNTSIRKAKAKINILVKIIQSVEFEREVGIEVTEVFKGGSLGQETAVVHHLDSDLVLYSTSLGVDDAVRDGYTEYLDAINSYLKKKLGDQCYLEDECTDVAVKFVIKQARKSRICVDLILSPYFNDIHTMLESLRKVEKSQRFKFVSASVKWQTEFIKNQDIWVRQLIIRAKAWRNIQWKDSNEGRPKSYLISVLVIMAYARLPSEMKTICRKGLRKIVPRVTEEFKGLVEEIKEDPRLDLSVPGSDRNLQDRYRDLLPDCPRIIDPVNPANNLYLSGIQRSTNEGNNWAHFFGKISSLDLAQLLLSSNIRSFFIHRQIFTVDKIHV